MNDQKNENKEQLAVGSDSNEGLGRELISSGLSPLSILVGPLRGSDGYRQTFLTLRVTV